MQRQTSLDEERQVEIVCPDSAYILYRMQQEFNGLAYAKTQSIPLPDYTTFTGEEDNGHTRLWLVDCPPEEEVHIVGSPHISSQMDSLECNTRHVSATDLERHWWVSNRRVVCILMDCPTRRILKPGRFPIGFEWLQRNVFVRITYQRRLDIRRSIFLYSKWSLF